MDTTGSWGACLPTYLSATPIIYVAAELTDEIMLAAVPICEETAPITGTMLKTAAVSFTTFAMLVILFNNGLTCHGNHCPTFQGRGSFPQNHPVSLIDSLYCDHTNVESTTAHKHVT